MLNFDAADPEKVGLSSSRLEWIGLVMQTYVESGKIIGLSTLIARKGRAVHFNRVGLIGILTDQSMMQFDIPEKELQVPAYQALID